MWISVGLCCVCPPVVCVVSTHTHQQQHTTSQQQTTQQLLLMQIVRRVNFAVLSIWAVRAFSINKSSPTFSPARFSSKMSAISDEVAAAIDAKSTDPAVNPYAPTFFDKIVSKEIPSTIIFEDDQWQVCRIEAM